MKLRAAKNIALAIAIAGMTAGAHAGIVVVIAAGSSVGSLSTDQVSNIFMGKVKTFPDGSSAVPIEQSEGSAGRNEFHNKVTGKDPAQLKAYWSQLIFSGKGQPPKEAGDSAAVKAAVTATAGGIGYIDESQVDASVKVILKP